MSIVVETALIAALVYGLCALFFAVWCHALVPTRPVIVFVVLLLVGTACAALLAFGEQERMRPGVFVGMLLGVAVADLLAIPIARGLRLLFKACLQR